MASSGLHFPFEDSYVHVKILNKVCILFSVLLMCFMSVELSGPATEPKRVEGSFSSPTSISCRDNSDQGSVPADIELTVLFSGTAVLTRTTSESSVMTRVQSALKEKPRVHWAHNVG